MEMFGCRRIQRSDGDRNDDFMPLTDVTQLRRPRHRDLVIVRAGRREDCATFGFHLVESGVDLSPIEGCQVADVAADEIERERCDEESDGARYSGAEWHDYLRQL